MIVDKVRELDFLELRRKAREHGRIAVPLVETVDREGAMRAGQDAFGIELEARTVTEVSPLRELDVL